MRNLDLLSLFHVLPKDRRFLKLFSFFLSLYLFFCLLSFQLLCVQCSSVGGNGSAFWDDWIIVYGVFVSPYLERLHSPPSYRYPFRACDKISCLAWPYHHGFLLLTWPLLCGWMDHSRSTFRACKILATLFFLLPLYAIFMTSMLMPSSTLLCLSDI